MANIVKEYNRNIYLISDTHFNHTNIIKYCSRPFKDAEEMNDHMIDQWNSVVKPQDKVYHLGDVYMGGSRGYTEHLLKHRLNGHKRLILGNHDNGKDQILHHAFEKIDIWRMFPEFGLLLTHVPVHRSALLKSGRNGSPDQVLLNVHGHIHERPAPTADHLCVCVEQINYQPVNIEEIRIV